MPSDRWTEADRQLVAELLDDQFEALGATYEAAAEAVLDQLTGDGWVPLRRVYGRSVAGHCPACGGSLFLGAGGHVTCRRIDCSRPTAADELLADREIEHIVLFGEGTFTVRHPLRERLDDELMTCELHEYIAGLAGPPVQPGRYRARLAADLRTWNWEAMPPVPETTSDEGTPEC